MGQTLSEPKLERSLEILQDGKLTTKSGSDAKSIKQSNMTAVACSVQGWRITMEDAHIMFTDEEFYSFGVFDGHGGDSTAIKVNEKFPDILRTLFKEHAKVNKDPKSIEKWLVNSFLDMDKYLFNSNDQSGSTAVSCQIQYPHVYTANAGDSRAILCRNGDAFGLSYDHKPTLESELKRIYEKGGFVEFGRVNGNLALSRAFGDFEYKQAYHQGKGALECIVTCMPDISHVELTTEDEFIVIACDGIWDCLSNQECANIVREQIATISIDYNKETDPAYQPLPFKRSPENKGEFDWLELVAERVMDKCIAPKAEFGGVGCDNMTLLIIALCHGKTLVEWKQDIEKKWRNSKTSPPSPTASPTKQSPVHWILGAPHAPEPQSASAQPQKPIEGIFY
eukprot:NODE_11_length_54881_cov_1.430718.p17 type:complete len:395 gc:universal NODE_11_length_54881_cov_1.430718:31658-32842(+)